MANEAVGMAGVAVSLIFKYGINSAPWVLKPSRREMINEFNSAYPFEFSNSAPNGLSLGGLSMMIFRIRLGRSVLHARMRDTSADVVYPKDAVGSVKRSSR